MTDFVDLNGASGATYRFRRIPEGEPHQRIAGNYAVLKPRARGFTVRLVGATNDLSQARAACPADILKGAQLYTRLNVSRAAREAEHEDLLANYGQGEPASGPSADQQS